MTLRLKPDPRVEAVLVHLLKVTCQPIAGKEFTLGLSVKSLKILEINEDFDRRHHCRHQPKHMLSQIYSGQTLATISTRS